MGAFRATEPEPEFELAGSVVKLDSIDPEKGGTVVVATLIDSVPRKVRLELAGEDYQHAIAAHGDGQMVSVEGELVRRRGGWELRTPRRFEVLEG